MVSGEASRVWRFGGVMGCFCVCIYEMEKWWDSEVRTGWPDLGDWTATYIA